MKVEEAIAILKQHNEWRRGAEIPMTDPKMLGEAIDTVVEQFEGSFISAAESYERGFSQGKEVGEREPSDEMIMRILNCIGYEEESWIGFVRQELEKRKESPTYDAEYLQSKIDAHTKRMEEQGLTSDKMLNECRGDDLLSWQDIRRIVQIADEMIDEDVKGNLDYLDTEEEYYMEILRKFNGDPMEK